MDMQTYNSILEKIFENENYGKLGMNELKICTLKTDFDLHDNVYTISFDDIKKQKDEKFLKIKYKTTYYNFGLEVDYAVVEYIPISSIIKIVLAKETSRREI